MLPIPHSSIETHFTVQLPNEKVTDDELRQLSEAAQPLIDKACELGAIRLAFLFRRKDAANSQTEAPIHRAEIPRN